MLVRSVECTQEGFTAARAEFEAFVQGHAAESSEVMKRIDALTDNLIARTEKGKDEYCDIMISFKASEPFVKLKDTQKTFSQESLLYEAKHEMMYGQNVIMLNL